MTGVLAHGLVSRADIPIPPVVFAWVSAAVLVVSFVALAALWPTARFERDAWHPLFRLPGWVDVACRAIGFGLLVLVVWAGFAGDQGPQSNFAPTFVYVVFWLGLIPASFLLGDVFRALNPWRAIGRVVAWVARTAARTDLPAPLEYPRRLGHWPAVAGIFAFAALELVASDGDKPENVAIAALISGSSRSRALSSRVSSSTMVAGSNMSSVVTMQTPSTPVFIIFSHG